MTTTTARIRGIPYIVEIEYWHCQHRNAAGEFDCDRVLRLPETWPNGRPSPVGPYALNLCARHYIEWLRAVVETRRIQRNQFLRDKAGRLARWKDTRRYPKEGRE